MAAGSLNHKVVAEYLLAQGFELTALELHAELQEAGKELKVLNEFFNDSSHLPDEAFKFAAPLPPQDQYRVSSNTSGLMSPGYGLNRGGASSGHQDISRSVSQMTLDSIDQITRYSEDTDRREEDRLAVLEYELRTARETIAQLRSSISHFTSEERRRTLSSGPQIIEEDAEDSDDIPLRPHEAKMINYLVNDYLVRHNYKFTAVTFSEECNEEDFDDWEDIHPTSLISLFRIGGQQAPLQPPPSQTKLLEEKETADQILKLQEEQDGLLKEQEALEDRLKRLEETNLELKATVHEREDTIHSLVEEKQILSIEIETVSNEKCKLEFLLGELEVEKGHLENKVEHLQLEQEREEGDGASLADDTPTLPNLEDKDLGFGKPLSGSPEFQEYLMTEAHVLWPGDEAMLIDDDLIQVLGSRLPTLVPSLVLAVRVEAVPLILHTLVKHPEAKVRDTLLALLFNMLKKPEAVHRLCILSGLDWLCNQVGWSSQTTEEEILPHLWQIMEYKHPERRQLVAEAVAVLCHHVSAEMRTSLLFSLLQQLIRDNEVEVVVSSIKSLSILLNSIQVQDKLYKVSETVIDALKRHPDKSSIVHALVRSLLPVIAISSENGPAFYDHIKLLLDAFPANCFMTKLSFLVEVLPLMAFTLTKHSPSSQPTIRDKPEESSNSTIREMFGLAVEESWLDFIGQDHDYSQFLHLDSIMKEARDILCTEAIQNFDATTKDNFNRLSCQLLTNSKIFLGSKISNHFLVEPLKSKSEFGSTIDCLLLFLAEDGSSPHEFNSFLSNHLRSLNVLENAVSRDQLNNTCRLLVGSGRTGRIIGLLEGELEEEGRSRETWVFGLLSSLAESSLESQDLDRCLGILLKEAAVHPKSATSIVLSILLHQQLTQEQKGQTTEILKLLSTSETGCLNLLQHSSAVLQLASNGLLLLRQLCALPQRWIETVPEFNNRGLCVALVQALIVVPQLNLDESLLTSCVLPGLAQMLQLLQNPGFHTFSPSPSPSSSTSATDLTSTSAGMESSTTPAIAMTSPTGAITSPSADIGELETAVLMLMSEVEGARRRNSTSFQQQQQQQQHHLQHEGDLEQQLTPQNQACSQEKSESLKVRERMQKLFSKPGTATPRRNIFKK